MKKKDFIEALKEAIRTEETAIAVYAKHLDAFCTRFQVDKIYIEKIKKTLNFLIQGETKHKKMCEYLIDKIKKENKNDY